MIFFDVNQHGEADLVTESGRHDENTESDGKSSVYEKLHLLPNFAVIKVLFRWFLWVSTDFGDFPTFWWGGHLKLGVSRKRDKEPATDDTHAHHVSDPLFWLASADLAYIEHTTFKSAFSALYRSRN